MWITLGPVQGEEGRFKPSLKVRTIKKGKKGLIPALFIIKINRKQNAMRGVSLNISVS